MPLFCNFSYFCSHCQLMFIKLIMPENIKHRPIFRMIHYKNVAHILENGICCRSHKNADPEYINIGDTTLISQRQEYSVGINPPGGNLGDFIPFYFGGHSPMLYNIKTGYRMIPQRPQEDIVYICCIIENIVRECSDWCFTDGHAKNHITEFYNDLCYLNKIDWEVIDSQWWHATENDIDKPRRKQAEFLVKNFIPVSSISAIIVKNKERKDYIDSLVRNTGLSMSINVDTNNKLYYP